jgi:hypothetical protein
LRGADVLRRKRRPPVGAGIKVEIRGETLWNMIEETCRNHLSFLREKIGEIFWKKAIDKRIGA